MTKLVSLGSVYITALFFPAVILVITMRYEVSNIVSRMRRLIQDSHKVAYCIKHTLQQGPTNGPTRDWCGIYNLSKVLEDNTGANPTIPLTIREA